MNILVYVYYDAQMNQIEASHFNYWHKTLVSEENPSLYVNEYTQKYLLHTEAIEFHSNFDTKLARIEGLEIALKKEKHESAVRQANIQEQIDKLLCLTHEVPEPDLDDIPY